ncbi:MAG: serine/threonine-protein kinase [Cytophagales bacterium]|nr:serine/threonine-protein kinase [Cytophagales bacterium]
MSKTKPAALPPDTLIGGYRIVRKLSVGGFGVVYLAKDKNQGWVAIKEYLPASLVTRLEGELLPSVSEDRLPLYWLGLKSFFDEGRALAQISHPAVVGVQNFFRANETIYMVMNYLQGATLQEFIVTARGLKRKKILHESTIRSLFGEVLHGLRIVHQSKMLHLDIKPANLMITNSNKAVLIDFGAARQVIHKTQDAAMRPMYTPGFAAPEMYQRDGQLGPWTDIYAVGASIYACMNGYPPVDSVSRLSKDKLSLLVDRLRGVYSDNLIELVEWCMALDPQARPQSILTLQKQLADISALRYQNLGLRQRVRVGLGKLFK